MEEMSEETIKKLVGDCFDALEKSTGYDNSVEPTFGVLYGSFNLRLPDVRQHDDRRRRR